MAQPPTWKDTLRKAVSTSVSAAIQAGIQSLVPTETWSVDWGGSVQRASDAQLRSWVRDGALTGLEFVRADGGEWVPLYRTALFAECAGAGDPRSLALWRAAVDASAWVAAAAAPPTALTAAWWFLDGSSVLGVGVVVAVWVVAIAVVAGVGGSFWRRASRAQALGAPSAPASRPTPQVTLAPADGPLGAALDRLEAVAARRPELLATSQLADLRRDVAQLAEQRRWFADVFDPHEVAALGAELSSVEEKLRGTQDPSLRRALTSQLDAGRVRRQFLEETSTALAELDARERALVHHVEAVRLSIVSAPAEGAVDVGERVKRLGQELAAEREVRRALRGPQTA